MQGILRFDLQIVFSRYRSFSVLACKIVFQDKFRIVLDGG